MSRNNGLLKRWRDGEGAPTWKPQSRVEKILFKILGADIVTEQPQSEMEELLLEIAEQGGGGGGEDTLGQLLAGTLEEYTNTEITRLYGGAFQGMPGSATLHFPALTEIGSSAHGTSGNTFNYYAGDIDVPNLTVADSAFNFGHSGITQVSWGLNMPQLYNFTFSGANKLRTAEIRFIGTYSTVGFGNNAFEGCTSLTYAKMVAKASSNTASSINSNCFKGCTRLTTLVLDTARVCELYNMNALNNTAIAYGMGYIYVPNDQVDAYKSATNWTVYADQIKPISELPDEYK